MGNESDQNKQQANSSTDATGDSSSNDSESTGDKILEVAGEAVKEGADLAVKVITDNNDFNVY